jgi:hypothetical protein
VGPEQAADFTGGDCAPDGGWGVGCEFVALSFGAHREGFLFEQVRTMVGLMVLIMREETIIDDDEHEHEDVKAHDKAHDAGAGAGGKEPPGAGEGGAESGKSAKANRVRRRKERDAINELLELSFHPDCVLNLPLAPMEGLYLVSELHVQ